MGSYAKGYTQILSQFFRVFEFLKSLEKKERTNYLASRNPTVSS